MVQRVEARFRGVGTQASVGQPLPGRSTVLNLPSKVTVLGTRLGSSALSSSVARLRRVDGSASVFNLVGPSQFEVRFYVPTLRSLLAAVRSASVIKPLPNPGLGRASTGMTLGLQAAQA
jgi:hypothetical protein